MAARRERERRKPSADRTYRFGSPEAALQAEDALPEATPAETEEAARRALDQASRRSRSARNKLFKLEVPRIDNIAVDFHLWPTFGTDVLAESRFTDNNRPIR